MKIPETQRVVTNIIGTVVGGLILAFLVAEFRTLHRINDSVIRIETQIESVKETMHGH